MLNQLYRLAVPIIQRKKEKWKASPPSDIYPIMELHDTFIEDLYQRLERLEMGELNVVCIGLQYKGLVNLKLKLDKEAWQRPNGIDQNRMACFAHDLLFYLMVNSLLEQATYLFGAYLRNEEQASQSSLYHRIKQNNHKVLNTYLNHLSSTTWLENILQRDEPNYFKEWYKLQKTLKHKTIPSALLGLLHDKTAQLDVLPVSIEEETKQLIQVERINHLMERFIQNQQWTALRELIHFCLVDCQVKRFMIDDFLQLQHVYRTDQLIEEDRKFWEEGLNTMMKTHQDYPPAYHLYQQIIQACQQQQPGKKTDCRQLCHYTIDWVGHPFTLLRLLHPILTKGQLLIDGSPDLSRLSAFLSSLLRIKKVRSEGYLTSSTLLTYMKKMNSGDIE